MISINYGGRLCTGCHGCAVICPASCVAMVCDPEGFWYPEVNHEQCIRCGLCIKVCPVEKHKSQSQAGQRLEVNLNAYAAYNTDITARLASSSGGVFSLLAQEVLDNNGVVFELHLMRGVQCLPRLH